MLDTLKVWKLQGKQYIPDITKPRLPDVFHGKPEIKDAPCAQGCTLCAEICPTEAIELSPVRLDLGKCTICGACERACPENIIRFTPDYKTATNRRETLVVSAASAYARQWEEDEARALLRRYFSSSLKLRQVSAAGCNGCEAELNACSNVNFDMGRFGIDFVASPRHADGVVITGPISENMARALELCYEAIPEPKLVIVFGACAISGGIFAESAALDRSFLSKYRVDLFVPGCPPHPLALLNGILEYFSTAN